MPVRSMVAAGVAMLVAVGGAVTASATADQAAAAASQRGCTPTWHVVPTPALPGGDQVSYYPMAGGQDNASSLEGIQVVTIDSISALSQRDVWFTGASQWPVMQPWNLHWDGKSLTVARQPGVPGTPQSGTVRGSSFASDREGWQLGPAVDATGFDNAPVASRWHDGRWTVVPTAVGASHDGGWLVPEGVASVSASDAWLAGASSDGTTREPVAERWDGTQWRMVPAAPVAGGEFAALAAVSAASVWAVGGQGVDGTWYNYLPIAQHWDGKSLRSVPVPGKGRFTAVSATRGSDDDVWAAGYVVTSPDDLAYSPLVEHWDGKSWSSVALPDVGSYAASAVYAAGARDVWVALQPSGGHGFGTSPRFLHFDGASWHVVTLPLPAEFGVQYQFTSLAGTGSADIWAAGTAGNSQDGPITPVIARLSC